MTTPDPKATLPSGKIIIEEAPFDGAHHGRVDGDWRPVAEEAPADNKQYARQNGGWSEVSAEGVDFGIGLSKDETAAPPIVHLQPAGDSPATLGGVYVVDRVRNVEEGLELGIDGRLRAPLATDSLAGTLLEPPPDDRGYVRARSAAGVSAWVPPADTPGYDYGTGLSVDRTPVPPDQPIVNLTPAGPLPQHLGGVYVPERDAFTQGLTVDMGNDALGDPATGELLAPPASDLLLGTLIEPPTDGLAYSRQWDNITDPANPKWVWVPALTAGLQITSIIPDKAIYGNGPLLTVHAYGSEFTPDCVVVIDGVDSTSTDVLSATEMTFVLNPAVPISEQFHIITVRDTVTAEIGLGAEQFDFIKATTEVDYGTGLSLDTLPTPPIVHLQPAGPTDRLLGGVWVPPRDATQGLAIDMGDEALGDPATGELRAPLATPELAGSIVEPPADAKGYVRTTQLDGTSQWVPPALTPTEYGVGLTYDETADPPIVHLQPAGFEQKFLGGIWAPARSLVQALDLNPATGLLQAPQATHEHLGAILEPRETGKTFGRQRDPTTGIADWVEVAGGGGIGDVPLDPVQPWSRTPGRWVAAIPEVPLHEVLYARRGGDPAAWEPFLPFEDVPADPTGQQYSRQHGNWHPIPPPHIENPAGKTEPEIGVVFVPDRSGLAVGPDGALGLEPATADEIGGLREVPGDGEWVRKRGAWEPLPAGSTVEAGIGLEKTGDVIDLQPPVASDPAAGTAPEIGGVYGTPRSDRNGIEIDGYGHISAPLATPELAGTIIEPVADARGYVRTTQLDGTSEWVPPAATEMATNTELGTVRVPARNDHNQGLDLDSNGFLFAPPATHEHLGTLLEPPNDGKTYARTNPDAGAPDWVEVQPGGIDDVPADPTGQQYSRQHGNWHPIPDAEAVVYGNGIDKTGPIVNLIPPKMSDPAAGTAPELGGVYTTPRSERNGIEIDGYGYISAPLATDELAGTIVEPRDTRQLHARVRDDATGNAQWEAFEPGIGDVSDTVNVYGRTNSRWIQLKPDGTFPPATMLYVQVRGDTMQGPLYLHAEGALAMEAVTVSQLNRLRVEAGIGLTQIGPRIDLQPATGGDQAGAPEIGGVYGTKRSDRNAVVIDSNGHINVPTATDTLLGGILEPAPDDKQYARMRTAAGVSSWVEVTASGVTISDTPPLAPKHEDLWWESDSGTMFIYYDDGTSSQWVDVTGSGYTLPTANTDGKIGGVQLVGRGPTQGLEYDMATGTLWAPLATNILAGSIVDAPNDGQQYARYFDTGTATWKWQAVSTGGVFVGDAPPPLPLPNQLWFDSDSGCTYIWYIDADSAQWVMQSSPSAGDTRPPPATTYVGDVPPPTPEPNQLWWDSDRGELFVWFNDGTSSQWVQTSGNGPAGIAEAPIDGTPYMRQDAAWVPNTTTAAKVGPPAPAEELVRWMLEQNIAQRFLDLEREVAALKAALKSRM